MKKQFYLFLTGLLCIVTINTFSQAPEKFNYQGVLRNPAGELVENTSITVKLSLLEGSSAGEVKYSESHTVSTNDYGQFAVQAGAGTVLSGSFTGINWSNEMYLKTEVANPAGGTLVETGTVQLISVPYALYSNKAKVLDNNALYFTETDTLFAVKDHDGNIVFAVFPDGAKVYVNETAKGNIGGFAVSGRTSNKAGVEVEYLRVTSDSTRVYVNDTSTLKGNIGGFAVSGRTSSKGKPLNYLQVLPDSTRIFVKDSIAGFGISNLESGTSESFLNLNKQNYFIGHQTGNKITDGVYNSMMGYQAGYNTNIGSNNLFLGYRSGYMNITGGNNVFIGTESGYVNQYTYQNTYVGYRSGYELSGAANTVLGSMAGENAGGGNNTFIGTSAGRIATGGNNTFVGQGAGYGFPDENTGVRNTYIGQAVGAKTTTGSYNVMLGFNAGYLNYEGSKNTFLGYDAGHNIHEGSGNIFIGYEAGKDIDGISNRLVIENSNADSTSALIYGEFDQNDLRINGNVGINYPAVNGYGLILDVPDGQTSTYTLWVYGSSFSSGGTWDASDEKFKKDIIPITSTVQKLSKLSGVYYNLKVDEFPKMKFSDKKQIGFLAQEVEQYFPELVKEDLDGNKAINYSKFTPILVEAIKEQQKQIDTLINENSNLKQQLIEMNNRLQKLEK
ncbi:MAG TPA: hypothetical protein DCQ24_05790 [Bacteroidales bacterium]|nr:hypothetical protein [Bacteroidales bacterium]